MMILHSKIIEVRQLSAVLLRQHFDIMDHKFFVWDKLAPEMREKMKKALLSAASSLPHAKLRKLVCDAACELAVSIIPKDGWPNFVSSVFSLCQSSNTLAQRLTGYRMLNHLVVWIADEFEDDMDKLRVLVETGLNDDELELRLAAHQVTCSLLPYCNDQEDLDLFTPLFPRMVESCTEAVKQLRHRPARQALEHICDAIESNPAFLTPHLDLFVNAMLRIAVAPSSAKVETNTKQMAIETLLTLCEVKPGLARKVPQVLNTVMPIILHCMTIHEENSDWNEGPDTDPDDSDADWAEESLNRICIAMGGKACLPIIFKIAKTYLAKQDSWRHRMVAARAVAISAEGCHDELFPQLPEFLTSVIPRLMKDPHPCVRCSVTYLVGQLSTDYKKKFTSKFAKLGLSALHALMKDTANPRIQAQAAAALVNWTDGCSWDSLQPFAEMMCSQLLELVQSGHPQVEEATVTAIAGVADVAKKNFAKFYPAFSGPLKAIWRNRTEKRYKELRGKTLEAITLIGIEVGPELFRSDAIELVRILLQVQDEIGDDDPLVRYVQQSWARLCKVLGEEFAQFLPRITPSLLKTAALPPDVEIHDGTYRTHRDGWHVVSIGDKSVAINNSKLEEKTNAMNMLFCLATELEASFFPYVRQVAEIAIPCLNFHYSDETRDAAVATMPQLMVCVKRHSEKNNLGPQLLHQLWGKILKPFLHAISIEAEAEVLLTMLDAFQECINLAGPNSMGPEELTKINAMIKQQGMDYFGRRFQRIKGREDPNFDEQDAKRIQKATQRDTFVLMALGEVIGKTFRHFGSRYLPLFQEHLGEFARMLLQKDKTPEENQVGICIFDDLIEFCQTEALGAIKMILPYLARGAQSKSPALRQASVYGIGYCAQYGGETFAPVVADSIGLLGKIITSPESRTSKQSVYATENAVSAFGKILLFWHSVIPPAKLEQFCASWLSWLPVKNDLIESKVTYATLCSLFEKIPDALVGENKSRLTHCVRLFTFIFKNSDMIDEGTNQRIPVILRKMASTWSDAFKTSAGSLKPPEQAKLRAILG